MKRFLGFLIISGLLLSFTLPLAAREDTEANKAVVTRWIEEIWNGNHTNLIPQLLTSDFIWHLGSTSLATADITGLVYANHVPGVNPIMSDYRLLAQGDLVAINYVMSGDVGTQSLSFPVIDIARIENGKISEYWTGIDGWLRLQQLGEVHVEGKIATVPKEWFPSAATSSTTPEENTTLVGRAAEIWNTGNTDSAGEVYAETLVIHLPLSVSTQPLDFNGMIQFIAWLRARMPDFRIETKDQPEVAEGDLVAYHYTWSGTFTQEREGAIPTKLGTCYGADLNRIEDGKIVEVWVNWDSDSDALPLWAWLAPQA
jgi:predicted SnoaL-like aldol condensation-catalyzing enzyme